MTKKEREITDIQEILRILDEGKVIHLALCDGDQPYVLPMNYGYTYEEGKLTFYIHGASKGYKYEIMKKNPKIAFSIECDTELFEGNVACQYGMIYASVMGKGNAVMCEEAEEKMAGLSILMKTQTGKDFEFTEKLVSIVNVVRIDITEFTAKKRPKPAAMQ
ncbi:MAG: pyridoxamine 5'-phosphate oxidase family protein [Clostridia bacterium]|nr:pyridoxamine 5'-phosphate oxidase family protein [Clostridia bacterium]